MPRDKLVIGNVEPVVSVLFILSMLLLLLLVNKAVHGSWRAIACRDT